GRGTVASGSYDRDSPAHRRREDPREPPRSLRRVHQLDTHEPITPHQLKENQMLRTVTVGLLSIVLTGAAFAADAKPATPPATSQQLINELVHDASKQPASADNTPTATVPLAVAAPAPATKSVDEIQGAALLRAGQKPPVIAKSNVVRYPFGESQP